MDEQTDEKCGRMEKKAGQEMNLTNCPLRIEYQGNDPQHCDNATRSLAKVYNTQGRK